MKLYRGNYWNTTHRLGNTGIIVEHNWHTNWTPTHAHLAPGLAPLMRQRVSVAMRDAPAEFVFRTSASLGAWDIVGYWVRRCRAGASECGE